MPRAALWLLLAFALAACRSPTQIAVDVGTDVPCAQVTSTAFTAGELGAIESLPATAVSSACNDDHLGTVVLVPSGDENAEVGFKIVTALNGATIDTCSGVAGANDPSCIVERRALRYIPNTPLTVIVAMSRVCEGVVCGPDSTCVNGACVSALIPDPTACEGPGCTSSVLGPADGGVDAAVDAPFDATVDANGPPIPDAGSPDSPPDTGSPGAGDAGGGPCTPGAQQCASPSAVQTCGANGQWGAPWPCATGACSAGACIGVTAGATSPSCNGGGPGLSNCGVDGGDSCCTSLEVPGGTYDRTYPSSDGGLADPATVDGFRLDKYLVTVGRFHQFVNAWDGGAGLTGGAGFEPDAGSGKHTYLNGGLGLADLGDGGPGYETGWLAADDANLGPTDTALACDTTNATWTTAPGGQTLPINCVVWQEAYAFCIWDGGFLPSEAEWQFAASGGTQERTYPWGSTDPGTANQYAVYGEQFLDGGTACYYPSATAGACNGGNIAAVGSAPLGAGFWGQVDLAGDEFEWTLDWFSFYADPSTNGAFLTSSNDYRSVRGAAFDTQGDYLHSSQRFYATPNGRGDGLGFRCARAP